MTNLVIRGIRSGSNYATVDDSNKLITATVKARYRIVALCAHRHFSLRLGLRIPCWYSIDSHTNRHLFRAITIKAITINKRPGSGAGVGRGTAHRFALRCFKSVLPRFVALVLYETRRHLGTKLCRATDQRSPYRKESTMRLARQSPAG